MIQVAPLGKAKFVASAGTGGTCVGASVAFAAPVPVLDAILAVCRYPSQTRKITRTPDSSTEVFLRYTLGIGLHRFGFARCEVRLLKRHRHPRDRRSAGRNNALARGGSRASKSNR